MFNCNEIVTVICTRTDPASERTAYYCYPFTGCGWYATHAAGHETAGRPPGGKVQVRLPVEAAPGFLPPWEWPRVDEPTRAVTWTLGPGTLLVHGAVAAVADAAALAALRRQYDTAEVTAWHDHRATAFPHVYAEGGV